MAYDVVELTQKLVSFPSVTPDSSGAQAFLAEKLEAMGFACTHLPFGDVPNLFARIGTGAPHLCFAGHTDVVPPGEIDKWRFGPFEASIEDGILYGRGASDMKGGIAAFVAAVSAYLENNELKGSISFLITGDEEGPAENGTVKVLEWMQGNGHIPDICLVGEPTNPDHPGQFIKIGRRGSFNAILTVRGTEGHVAHPHLGDNPVPKLMETVQALGACVFDEGTERFQPSHLEFTTLDAGEYVDNLIPAVARAKFNVRFNPVWTKETLEEKIREILDGTGHDYTLESRCDADSTVVSSDVWPDLVRRAVEDVTGEKAAYTTQGGTSDARFIGRYCPTLEFGGVNATIHKINESARIEDLQVLGKIYTRLIALVDHSAADIF